MDKENTWESFVADMDSAMNGQLDMEVLNKMWELVHCTLYHIDHSGRVQLFMYVKRMSHLCVECCDYAKRVVKDKGREVTRTQCGKCIWVAVKHGDDYVPTRVFVKGPINSRECSGWMSSNTALCWRQVRNYFQRHNVLGKIQSLPSQFPPYVAATRDIFSGVH